MYIASLFLVHILIVCAAAQIKPGCPSLFLRYSATHTYCKSANPTCNILSSSISAEERDIILKEHNNYRSKLALGQYNNLPTASDMMQMVWDDELAAVAEKHAQQCSFEHDCGNCRRVQNFGVGQNLAIEQVFNSPDIPNSNWPAAIKSWFDEIAYFTSNAIDPFIAPPPKNTYGHFSQLMWATSWRIGCGYALYKKSNSYEKLYTCNYGETGNMIGRSMYKSGPPCSACPINSCCDSTCGAKAEYSALCKITDNKAPKYNPVGSYLFYCDFDNRSDCKNYVTGKNKWLVYNTLSGNYLGIELQGGDESSITFKNKFVPNAASFCFVIRYRKGPNKAGEEEASTATLTFVGSGFEVPQVLPDFNGDAKQQFNQFNMDLGWNMETEIKITFKVPAGKPEQFFEIENIYATDGGCQQ